MLNDGCILTQEAVMHRFILALTVGIFASIGLPQKARSYDIDCAIMLCMAGGFPPSAVCARAYRTMIRRITPWPSLPPFGVCTYAKAPASLSEQGGTADLDISEPEFAWLRKTRILWWYGDHYNGRDGPGWSWSLRSCDGENRSCRLLSQGHGVDMPWPSSFRSENGQEISTFGPGTFGVRRAVMIEYGDFEGILDHSNWYSY